MLLYVDIFHANRLVAAPAPSDPSGTGFAHLPIPNNPALAGSTIYAQALWIEDPGSGMACGRSPYHVASSNAVAVVILQ